MCSAGTVVGCYLRCPLLLTLSFRVVLVICCLSKHNPSPVIKVQIQGVLVWPGQVRIYDEDFLKSDDDLGVAMAGLQDLADGESHTLGLPLRGSGSTGSVTLQARFLPFTGGWADAKKHDACGRHT